MSAYAYVPAVPPRRPLEPAQRRAALVAGGWGFGLSTLGGWLIGAALAALAFAVVLTAIARIVVAADGALPEVELVREFAVLTSPPVLALMFAVAFLGAALVALGLVLSARILRRRGVPRHWSVTWAGWGISVAVSSVLGSIAGVAGNVASSASAVLGTGVDVPVAAAIALGVVSALVALAVNIAIGALAWWWMAHVMRAP